MVRRRLPGALRERARVQAPDAAQTRITFLLAHDVQELEKTQRRQAYEASYAACAPEDAAEELALLAEFAPADAEVTDATPP